MKVKFKKLHPEAVIPKYARQGDAGLDLTATRVEKKGKQYTYKTGLAVEIPEGYVGYLYPRSSIFKKDLRLSNCVGVVDSGYRGELNFIFDEIAPNYLGDTDRYEVGDRIGQLVIMPYPHIEPVEAEELAESERGANGYGSTGA